MDMVSIILTTRQSGNNDVDVIVECEFKYNALALCVCSGKIIELAQSFGGKLIPWVREPYKYKFCHVFRFETEDMKRNFLEQLFKKW